MIKKWLKALRSGDYLQGRASLVVQNEDGQHYFCCLGVAVNECLGGFDEVPDSDRWRGYVGGSGSCLSISLLEKLGLTFDQESILMHLNDREGYTFEQIADYIEEHYL